MGSWVRVRVSRGALGRFERWGGESGQAFRKGGELRGLIVSLSSRLVVVIVLESVLITRHRCGSRRFFWDWYPVMLNPDILALPTQETFGFIIYCR